MASPRHAGTQFKPPDFSHIEAVRNRLKNAERATLTVISYERDFRVFRAWCAAAGRSSLPASSDTVELYVVDLLQQDRKITTLKRHLAGIQHYHRAGALPNPCTASVRQLLAGAQRLLSQQPARKAALSSGELRDMVKRIGRDTAIGARDSAILLIGFASALRRSSLARLNLDDVTLDQTGLLLRVVREKQARKGEVRTATARGGRYPSTCPVRALDDWLGWRGPEPGPLFCHVSNGCPILKPLLPNRIGQIVHAAVRSIGLNPALYGAHSLRAGCVTEALSNGADALTVARHTGHRSVETVQIYDRERDPWRGHVGRFLGL